MQFRVSLCLLVLALLVSVACGRDFYAHSVKDAEGRIVSLDQYKGRVSLVVNVASKCGYTDSTYKDLVKLQSKFSQEEFIVLAFPCNQFGEQEPWSAKKVKKWAKETYNVNFPIFGKIRVRDDDEGYADAAFSNLIFQLGQPPTWNFWKFLVDHHGRVVSAWNHKTPIKSFEDEIFVAVKALPPRGGSDEDEEDGIRRIVVREPPPPPEDFDAEALPPKAVHLGSGQRPTLEGVNLEDRNEL